MANPQQQYIRGPAPVRQTWGSFLLWKFIVAAITWPIILILSALVGYRPSAVDARRFTGERWPVLTWVSVALWVSGLMAVFFSLLLTPISLVVTVPLMLLTAARVAAAPYGLPLGELISGARDLWAVGPRWRKAAQIGLGVLALAAVLGVVLYTGKQLYWSLPGWLELVALGAVVLAVLIGLFYLREVGARHRDDVQRIYVSQSQLAAAVGGLLGMQAEKVLEQGLISPLGEGNFAISPVPATAALKGRDEMEQRIAQLLPDMRIVGFSADRIDLAPAPDEIRASREIMAESGGLIVGMLDEADTDARPGAARWSLAPGTSPAQAAQAQAHAASKGFALVEWAPYENHAIVAKLSPLAQQVRAAVAVGFGVQQTPWEVEAEVAAGDTAEAPVAEVRILRSPAGMADRRGRALADALLRIPGGHAEWAVRDDLATGQTTLTWVKRPELPAVVEGRDLLPAPGTVGSQELLPVGRYADGSAMIADLKAGPHTLVVGGTGTGKSTFTRLMLVKGLLRGFELVYADAPKRGAGLYGLEQYARAWEVSGSRVAVAALLQAVYAEVQRRVALIAEHRAEAWDDLPAELGIRPMLVVIDEFRGHVAVPTKAPAAKGTEAYQRWEEASAAAASILDSVGLIAAEARSAGMRLVLLTQRPDAVFIPGDVRDNLGTTIQLVNPKKTPSAQALGMSFSGDTELIHGAQDQIRRFNNGRPGFAVTAVEGGAVAASRIGYLRYSAKNGLDEAADILAERGVPVGVPLAYAAPKGPSRDTFGTEINDDETVVEYDDLDFSDLDFSDFK